MAASEHSFSEEITAFRRWYPLPWLLLVIAVIGWIGTLWIARGRVEDERAKVAQALRASDEVASRLRQAEADRSAMETKFKELETFAKSLEVKVQGLSDELKAQSEAKAAPQRSSSSSSSKRTRK